MMMLLPLERLSVAVAAFAVVIEWLGFVADAALQLLPSETFAAL
mgnify:CR=1 FL=1